MLDIVYDVKFSIGGFDLSHNVYSVEIGASINNIMHGIIIKAKIDSVDIFKNEVFGQKDGHLEITFTSQDQVSYEHTKLDVIISNMFFVSNMQSSDENISEHPQSQDLQFQCVPKQQFVAMYTIVNRLFTNDSNVLPIDAMTNIIDTFSNTPYNIDRTNVNKVPIRQMQVPPMNLCKSIKFIDSKYPLYANGIPFLFGDIDGTLRISNLKSYINNDSKYDVFILTKGIGADDTKDILTTASKGDSRRFFTYKGIQTHYSTNKNIINGGFEKKYTVAGKDQLTETIVLKADNMYKNGGMKSKDSPLFYNEALKSRTVVDTSIIGEDSPMLPVNDFSKTMANNSRITLSLDGNLPIQRLLMVGVPMEVKTSIPSYQDYSGKYISVLSDIKLQKIKQNYFTCAATISCARSNY